MYRVHWQGTSDAFLSPELIKIIESRCYQDNYIEQNFLISNLDSNSEVLKYFIEVRKKLTDALKDGFLKAYSLNKDHKFEEIPQGFWYIPSGVLWKNGTYSNIEQQPCFILRNNLDNFVASINTDPFMANSLDIIKALFPGDPDLSRLNITEINLNNIKDSLVLRILKTALICDVHGYRTAGTTQLKDYITETQQWLFQDITTSDKLIGQIVTMIRPHELRKGGNTIDKRKYNPKTKTIE